jgi:hypothetical protein
VSATISQARTALAGTLAMDGVQVSPFPPGTVNVPALVVTPSEGEFLTYKTSFDGSPELTLLVTAFIGRGQDRSSTDLLDEFTAHTGTRSVFAAVDADQTLGGVVVAAGVVGAGNFGSFAYAGAEYLGCTFTVEIML